MTITDLETIINKEKHMKISDHLPQSKIKALFTSYVFIIEQNKLNQVIKENPKTAVHHVLSVISPKKYKQSSKRKVKYFKFTILKDIFAFVQQTMEVANNFALVDTGHPIWQNGGHNAVRNKLYSGDPPYGDTKKDDKDEDVQTKSISGRQLTSV